MQAIYMSMKPDLRSTGIVYRQRWHAHKTNIQFTIRRTLRSLLLAQNLCIHIKHRNIFLKPDYDTLTLCVDHHVAVHVVGEGVDMRRVLVRRLPARITNNVTKEHDISKCVAFDFRQLCAGGHITCAAKRFGEYHATHLSGQGTLTAPW